MDPDQLGHQKPSDLVQASFREIGIKYRKKCEFMGMNMVCMLIPHRPRLLFVK